ncbi:MAG: 6-bladed beta-propeller [Candidatus Omnitrophota bacterium]
MRILIGLTLILAFMSFFLDGAQVEKIEKRIENGVEVIVNHLQPYKVNGLPLKVTLKAENAIDLDKFEETIAIIGDLDADKTGNIYLLDVKYQKIVVLNKKGEFLSEFGREGQGPGEFRSPLRIRLNRANQIVITDPLNRKFSFFQTNGKFIKDIRFTPSASEGIILDKENGNFVFKKFEFPTSKTGNIKILLQLYDAGFNEIKTLDEMEMLSPLGSKLLGIYNTMGVDIAGNTIITGNQERGYDLSVYNFSGKLLKRIQKKFEPVSPSEDYKKAFIETLGKKYQLVKNKLVFPDALPAFHQFSTDPEGRLYVMTYERDKNNSGYMVDVFNSDGIFISRFVLKAPPYPKAVIRVVNNRLYYLYNQESGSQMLEVYKIDWGKGRGA